MGYAIQNKQELISIIRNNKQKLHHLGVAKLSLFGSLATGHINPESDVDFLVEFSPGMKTYDNFMELSFFLEDLTGRKIELVTPQSLNKYIGPHILKQAEYVGF